MNPGISNGGSRRAGVTALLLTLMVAPRCSSALKLQVSFDTISS